MADPSPAFSIDFLSCYRRSGSSVASWPYFSSPGLILNTRKMILADNTQWTAEIIHMTLHAIAKPRYMFSLRHGIWHAYVSKQWESRFLSQSLLYFNTRCKSSWNLRDTHCRVWYLMWATFREWDCSSLSMQWDFHCEGSNYLLRLKASPRLVSSVYNSLMGTLQTTKVFFSRCTDSW